MIGASPSCRHLVAGLALLMSACQLFEAPSGQGPDVPAAFVGSRTVAPRASTGWLADLSDRQLTSLVDEAMLSNNDLAASAARLRTARANVGITRASMLPQVNATGGSNRVRGVAEIDDGFGGSNPISNYATHHDLGANLNWEIDLWGKLGNRTRAAAAEANAASADYHAFRLSLAANIARSWFNAAELELQVKLASDTATSLEKNLRFVERGVDLGTSEALDLRLTRANVENARSNLDAQRRQLDAATRSLEILIGRYPANQLQVKGDLPDIRHDVPTGLPSELLMRRPDLVSSEQRLAAASERVVANQKEYLPDFNLTARGGTSSSELRNLLNPDYLAGSIAANLGQPIYDGGRIKGNIEAAKGRYQEALANFRQDALQAFGEVETSLAAELYLKSQVASQQRSATESLAAENLAWDQYSRGLVGGLTWLEAQRRSFNSRSALLQLKNLRLQNRIDLYLALGGDFKTQPGN